MTALRLWIRCNLKKITLVFYTTDVAMENVYALQPLMDCVGNFYPCSDSDNGDEASIHVEDADDNPPVGAYEKNAC